MNQRLFNIYDGPAYQDSNAYLNIKQTTRSRTARRPTIPRDLLRQPAIMYGRVLGHAPGRPRGLLSAECGDRLEAAERLLLSARLSFAEPLLRQDVDIRHFVIEPLFLPGTFQTNDPAGRRDGVPKNRYCTWNPTMFDNFTDIDRQTELNDDDGSLTGYVNTISVNEDHFFNAPIETFECDSDLTAKTSPYDYVTTVVYPGCVAERHLRQELVDAACVRRRSLLRRAPLPAVLTREENGEDRHGHQNPTIRMAGQAILQRSTLSANNGTYYIDTTVSQATQSAVVPPRQQTSTSSRRQTYYVFLVFAKATTPQTYQLYVGTQDSTRTTGRCMVRADVHTNAYTCKLSRVAHSPCPNPGRGAMTLPRASSR